MTTMMHSTRRALIAGAAGTLLAPAAFAQDKPLTLLNVSYDPTRELYKQINVAYADYWEGQDRPGDQDRPEPRAVPANRPASVIDGLQADVVTLALAADIDEIATRAKLLPATGKKRRPQQHHALHLDHRVPGAGRGIPRRSATGPT